MKLKIIILACATFGIFSFNALSQERFTADKVVAVVGSSSILYSDVEQAAKSIVQQRREEGYTSDRDPMAEALEALMLRKLLYNQAQVDSLTINTGDITESVQQNINQMIFSLGSIAALEAYYHQPIFDIRQTFQNRYEEQAYANQMRYAVQKNVKVTPGEVERFFRSLPQDSLPIVPEQYIYAHITKFPSSTVEAKQRVRERLLELRERIIDGAQFDMLARMYSLDPVSAIRGGEMELSPKESFVQPFADALTRLRPGQVSEVVETEYGFHIIQLLDNSNNLYHLRHILLKPMFTQDELIATATTLDSIATVIRNGEMTFEEAAAKFSEDQYSRLNGGLANNNDLLVLYNAFDPKLATTRFFREDLPVEDYRELSRLRVGEMSQAFFTQTYRGDQMAKIVKLVEIIPAHPASLKEDYLDLEELTLRHKQSQEFEKWLNQKIDAMYIRVAPEFHSADFENKRWIK